MMLRLRGRNPITANLVNEVRDNYTQILLLTLILGTAVVGVARLNGAEFTGIVDGGTLAPIMTVVFIALFVAFRSDIARPIISNLILGVFVLIPYWVLGDAPVYTTVLIFAAITPAILARTDLIYWTFIGLVVLRLAIDIAFIINDQFQAEMFVLDATILTRIAIAVVPLLLSLIIRSFISRLEDAAAEAQRAASLLETSADIGQSMSQSEELNAMLSRSVGTIRDRFAFYHVQIFLADEDSNYAFLTASTGDIGRQMLARGHRLLLDSNSVVGRVARSGEAIIARDTDRESGHAFNELLPDTRSELGVPIMDSQGIIGVLDLQSRRPDAFTQSEIRVLKVIANQLSGAIRSARLFEAQAQNLRENKRLFIESETNLREIQRLNRQLTRQAWQDYLGGERRVDGVTLEGKDFDNRADWTEEMLQASQRRRPIRGDEQRSKLAVPIELRGEVVGAIEIETDGDQDKDDVIDMVQAISQRLAVSLDNARLFEEAHQATAQEERVGELVSGYQTADTVDDLLKITLQGLAETLGAEQASIRISTALDKTVTPTVPDNNGMNNGASDGESTHA